MRSVASARGVRGVERVAQSGTRRAERVRREERVVRVNRAVQVHEIQHPPAVSARRSDAEAGPEIFKQRRREPFGENVCELTSAWNL